MHSFLKFLKLRNRNIIRSVVAFFSLLVFSAFSYSSDIAAYQYPQYPSASGVEITFQVDSYNSDPSVSTRLERCYSLAQSAYYALPYGHRTGLRRLVIVWSSTMGRGLGGGDTIYLRCNNVSDSEFVGVFVHEVGHIVDTGVVQGNAASGVSVFKDDRTQLFNDDASLEFYSISWVNTKRKQARSSSFDFVTGYAQNDPFEDFAETYNFFLLQGKQFAEMAQQNERLQRKYVYMRDRIFNGQTFINNNRKAKLDSRSFDSTVLPFSLEKFLKRG